MPRARIHSLVTWICIRPDIKTAIQNEIINLDDVSKHLVLNEHYFIVEKTANALLKSHFESICSICFESTCFESIF